MKLLFSWWSIASDGLVLGGLPAWLGPDWWLCHALFGLTVAMRALMVPRAAATLGTGGALLRVAAGALLLFASCFVTYEGRAWTYAILAGAALSTVAAGVSAGRAGRA
jgi:hypothetical protein